MDGESLRAARTNNPRTAAPNSSDATLMRNQSNRAGHSGGSVSCARIAGGRSSFGLRKNGWSVFDELGRRARFPAGINCWQWTDGRLTLFEEELMRRMLHWRCWLWWR